MRDHESGASAAGVRVPSLKLAAFVTGAALAALGGGMLAMGVRAFDPTAYDPVRGLLWFAAIVVLGADSTLGALAAAALLVGLDAGTEGGVAAAVVGVLAVLVGRFPGGPYEAVRAGSARLRRGAGPDAGSRRRGYGLGSGCAPVCRGRSPRAGVRLRRGALHRTRAAHGRGGAWVLPQGRRSPRRTDRCGTAASRVRRSRTRPAGPTGPTAQRWAGARPCAATGPA